MRARARPFGSGLAQKKRRKGYVGLRSAQPKVPGLGLIFWAGPTYMF